MPLVSDNAPQGATLNALSIFLFWFFICMTVACVTIAMVTLHRLKKRERALAKSGSVQEETAGVLAVPMVEVPAVCPRKQEHTGKVCFTNWGKKATKSRFETV